MNRNIAIAQQLLLMAEQLITAKKVVWPLPPESKFKIFKIEDSKELKDNKCLSPEDIAFFGKRLDDTMTESAWVYVVETKGKQVATLIRHKGKWRDVGPNNGNITDVELLQEMEEFKEASLKR